MKLLLFDLDDTLLRSDKTISSHTQTVLNRCREHGVLIGISTSRSLPNSLAFLGMLDPEIIIASGGALVQVRDRIVSRSEFSANEVQRFLRLVREICGECETTGGKLGRKRLLRLFRVLRVGLEDLRGNQGGSDAGALGLPLWSLRFDPLFRNGLV